MQIQSPFKVLLNNEGNKSTPHQRSSQQIQLLQELLKNNSALQDFNLSSDTIKQICNRIVLIWSENPHINDINNNEIYLVLEGKAFEYVQNKSMSLKAKLHENSDYIMVRKLSSNDFFLVYSPPGRYKNQHQFKKYQLMVDQKTLLGKISDQLFNKIFLPTIQDRFKKISDFLKKVQILQSLPQLVFHQLSKYMLDEDYEAGSHIIKKDEKSQYVFFIKKGEVQFRTYHSQNKDVPSKNYALAHSKSFKKYYLREYEVFGMDAFNAQTYEEENSTYSAEAKTNCSLFKIDKKILAIVISSFEEDLKSKNKIWSSINLNEQIQGQGYQTPDKILLNENAHKIKTSEKKIRDIKLRYLNTSKNQRVEKKWSNIKEQQKQFQSDDFLISDLKYKSCHNFQVLRDRDMAIKEKFKNTFRSKFNNFGRPATVDEAPIVSRIVISAYDQNINTQSLDLQKGNHHQLLPKTSNHIKRKSIIMNSNGGKEQTDIIKGFLEQRIKNESKKKTLIIQEKNEILKKKEKINIKRVFSVANTRLKSGAKNEIGEELFHRMNNMNENPLLFKIENQRKKLQNTQKKIIERRVKSQKKTIPSKPANELILIKNN